MVVVEDLYPEVISLMRPYVFDPMTLKTLARKFRDHWLEILELERKGAYGKESDLESQENEDAIRVEHDVELCREKKYELTGIRKIPKEGEDAICLILVVHLKTVTLALVNNREDYPPNVIQQLSTHLEKITPERVARTLAEFVKTLDEDIQNQSLVVGIIGRLQVVTPLCEQLKMSIKNYPILEKVFFTDIPINSSVAWLLERLFRDPDVKATLQLDEDFINYSMLKRIFLIGKDEKDKAKITTIVNVPLSSLNTLEIFDIIKSPIDEMLFVKNKRRPKDNNGNLAPNLATVLCGPELAESLRLCLIKAIDYAGLLQGFLTKKIQKPYSITLKNMFAIEQYKEHEENFLAIFQHLGYEAVSYEDGVQIKFISRVLVRRTCSILAASLVGLACISPKTIPSFIIGGDFLNYPKFRNYFEYMVDILKPFSLQIDLQFIDKTDEAIIGASLLTASSAAELVQREQGLRSLPPFLLAECCYQEIQKYINCP